MTRTANIPAPPAPMEARPAETLPAGAEWWFEPKWDGFRCLASRSGDEIALISKSGKPLDRYFPDMVEVLRACPSPRFLLDGELLIQDGGAFSFEALQMRLHPSASRVATLAAAHPAHLTLFDLLREGDEDLGRQPFGRRRKALEAFAASGLPPALSLTPGTADRNQAQAWLDAPEIEGVVAKRLDLPYRGGERSMVKVKRVRTADCVVGGFRYEAAGAGVGSLLLGLYDDGDRLRHVGFTSGLSAAERSRLVGVLEPLRGGEGFDLDRPGGPSRWNRGRSVEWTPLRPCLVAEVSFDHVSGGRFRHGTRLLRFRPDKAPLQCRMEQIGTTA